MSCWYLSIFIILFVSRSRAVAALAVDRPLCVVCSGAVTAGNADGGRSVARQCVLFARRGRMSCFPIAKNVVSLVRSVYPHLSAFCTIGSGTPWDPCVFFFCYWLCVLYDLLVCCRMRRSPPPVPFDVTDVGFAIGAATGHAPYKFTVCALLCSLFLSS